MSVKVSQKGLSLVLFFALMIAGCQQAPTEESMEAQVRGGAEAGRYIVVFNDNAADAPGLARKLSAENGGRLLHTYEHALKGFAAELPARAVEALQHNPNVAFIEADQVMTASTTQSGATWGLDRIDQRALPLSSSYSYGATGSGVTAYIVDTGINTAHAEFGTRASFGFDAFGGNGQDCNGHGSHVAGTVGGATYGVAKDVKLVAVRVLDCSGNGSTSGVIAGVDWVTANHTASAPAVANMSLGGGASTALDNAVAKAIADGVTFAVAAGNGNIVGIAQDACKYSPARVADALTIGASDKSDRKASFSNYGKCVDWFAPGVSITSAWYTSNTATNTISGTSMATPHVAGVAAQYLGTNPSASPAAVRSALWAKLTQRAVSSSKTTNNHLLFTDF